MARRELAAQAPLSARGPGTAPRLVGRGRSSHSASPRPERVRPVDTVKLAKDELSQKAATGKTARLRLAALPPAGAAVGGGAPGLHEGFYDFAAAVVNPKPSARDHATQLREWLEAELGRGSSLAHRDRRLSNESSRLGCHSRATSAYSDARLVDEVTMKALPPPPTDEGSCPPEPGTFLTSVGAAGDSAEPDSLATGSAARAEEAEQASAEIEICLEVLEKYAEDTTTESKERGALLCSARTASTSAIRRLKGIMDACTEETRKSKEEQDKLEAQVADLSEDNAGLRHVVQQMLAEESKLRAGEEALERKVTSLEEHLKEAQRRIQVLTGDLENANGQLRELEDRQGYGEAVRDACTSPMMGFASFTLGAPPGYESQALGVEGLRGTSSLSGLLNEPPALPDAVHGQHYDRQLRRRTLSIQHQQGARPSGHTLSMEMSRTNSERNSKLHQILNYGERRHTGSVSPRPFARMQGSEFRQGGGHLLPERGLLAENGSIIEGSDDAFDDCRESVVSSNPAEEVLDETPEPVPVAACAFPALIPFLDFSGLDLDYAQDDAGAIQRNREHLETHLAMLEEEHGQAISANETLQGSVDVALEQLLVWVQAVWDSLQDFNSRSVTREMQALEHLRSAIEWLATHPCRDWTKPQERLARVLDEHEGQLRGALASDRAGDPEVLELRQALAVQRQRTEELTDSLVEVRSSLGGNRSRTKQGDHGNRRSSPLTLQPSSSPETRHSVHDMGTQCDLLQAVTSDAGSAPPASSIGASPGLLGTGCTATPVPSRPRSLPRSSGLHSRCTDEASRGQPDDREGERGDTARSSLGVLSHASEEELPAERGDGIHSPEEGAELEVAAVQPEEEREGGEQEEEEQPEESVSQHSELVAHAAAAEADLEAKKMRLLRSPFVEGIDLTTVPPSQRVLLKPEAAPKPDTAAAAAMAASRGLKTLHAFIAEVYSVKKVDDQRRDKARQPRRELYVVLQELMRQKHGVRNVVHQRSWLLVESLVQHAGYDQAAAFFADFLDGSRDLHELSFYLYCSSVLSTHMAEESQEISPARPVVGCVAYERATRAVELLFGELPKALEVMYVELQKCARARPPWPRADGQGEDHYDSMFASGTMDGSSRIVPIEDLYKVLLEGWRASLLLLDKSAPLFSWRQCVLAFIQTDVLARGWLDPHEVRESEELRLELPVGAASGEGLRILERTSLGAYVFRAFHRCSSAKPPPAQPQAPSKKNALVPRRARMEKEVSDHCLQISQEAFESVERTLGVYLTWLMHSEDLRDLALYNSVKARIYGFRQAAESHEAGHGAHEFRCLLLLLLSHQFDVQRQRGGLGAEHLQWELNSLLTVLRESWRRGASNGTGFGADLEDDSETPRLTE